MMEEDNELCRLPTVWWAMMTPQRSWAAVASRWVQLRALQFLGGRPGELAWSCRPPTHVIVQSFHH